MKNEKQPNFFLIGASKSGTTSLHHYLDQHPEITMSTLKEPHYYSFKGEEINFSSPFDKKRFNSHIIRAQEEYSRLFKSSTKVIGESSTSYLRKLETAKRIKEDIQNPKIIAILRDPIEAMKSEFLMSKRFGFEVCESLDKALEFEQERINSNWFNCTYLEHRKYFKYLSPFYKEFDSANIKILLYEDLKESPQKLLKEIYTFLEVNSSFETKTELKYNSGGGTFRNKTLGKILNLSFPLKKRLRSFIPTRIRKNILEKVWDSNIEEVEVLTKIKELELKQLLTEDISHLEKLINRNLQHWLR